jgi:hypothetical protein
LRWSFNFRATKGVLAESPEREQGMDGTLKWLTQKA